DAGDGAATGQQVRRQVGREGRPVGGDRDGRQVAARRMAGDDDTAGVDALHGGIAVQPGEGAAHLVYHGADRAGRRQQVVEAGEGDARLDEGGREVAEVALVEPLPVAAVDEGQE